MYGAGRSGVVKSEPDSSPIHRQSIGHILSVKGQLDKVTSRLGDIYKVRLNHAQSQNHKGQHNLLKEL